jgi:uncharacterized protein YjbJ (UPF0337 family)
VSRQWLAVARNVRTLDAPEKDGIVPSTYSEGELAMSVESGDRDRIEGTVEEVKGKGKQAVGDLTDDERLKAEGMLDEAKGRAQQFLGDIKDKVDDIREDAEKATR